jgi:hypothetical protein
MPPQVAQSALQSHERTQLPIYRPPSDPRFKAVIAAGVMILISSVFAMIVANVTLSTDLWNFEWDWEAEEEIRVLDTTALYVGVTFAAASIIAFISTYFMFRTKNHISIIAGPAALLAAYFSLLFYDPDVMIIMVHILVTTILSLLFLYYARNLFKMDGRVVSQGPSIVESEQKG